MKIYLVTLCITMITKFYHSNVQKTVPSAGKRVVKQDRLKVKWPSSDVHVGRQADGGVEIPKCQNALQMT